MPYTVNIRGRLLDLSRPAVMGILNVTPDSFYAASRVQTEEAVALRARQIVAEGGSIIDVGACSTRPGGTPAGEAEEMARLRLALPVVRREAPGVAVSVDTFRPGVARMAVEELGADIVNDVGDPAGCPCSAAYPGMSVPYILTSAKPTLRETLLFFAEEVQRLCDRGQKDIILDPGFGFGKTVDENYVLLADLERLQVLDLPVLVGLSRKSMIYKPLGITPGEALSGTTALHAVALMKGANILRVHDVKDAVQTVRLYGLLRKSSAPPPTPNSQLLTPNS